MYKILPAISVFLFCNFFASAQFKKGDLLLGGQLSFLSQKVSGDNYGSYPENQSSGVFQVSIGKAIKENAVLGISLGYAPTTIDNYTGYTNYPVHFISNGYSAFIFYRLYKSLGKDFFLFGEAGVGYKGYNQTGKDSIGNKALSVVTNQAGLYLVPGIDYKISKKFFLELTIPNLLQVIYSSTKSTISGQTNIEKDFLGSASLSSNPLNSLSIGFQLIL